MPELPEVETVCRGLSKKILNSTILKVKILNRKLRYDIPSNLENIILDKKIKGVLRRGKTGFFILNGNYIIIFHLGMTGKFKIERKKYIHHKHDHLEIEFENNVKLIYNDIRKFGYILITEKPVDIFNFNKVGCEPFLATSFKKILYAKLIKRKTSIKSILLDQTFICGIGNIYASEILFNAKMSPFKKGEDISQNHFLELLESIEFILSLAIKKGGSSIKNYSNVNNDLGYFQTKFKVYNRYGLNCNNCKSLINKVKQNGRTTFFCNKCQS
ncbi:MAG: DNA-formamidopyrimidine glycosylase [Rickettsiales bacterium]|nr:DNA-formamidopyrimidine glycosylase [Rickettsiales bacterium]OUV78389.1 MAG: DNA-formamidopyrimidine glycosylase [Rickettsiales bacterium TMED131]